MKRAVIRSSLGLMLTFAMQAASCADLAVYTDVLQNGFENWSYGGGSDFANPTPVHGGTASIALSGNAFNAISFAHPAAALSSADWPLLTLWVHGGSAGGQRIRIVLQNGGNLVAQAALDAYPGGTPLAGAWRAVTVALTQPPLSYAGAFDRIDLQSDAEGTQPTLYFDDVALSTTTAVPDTIFEDGFEARAGAAALAIDHDIAIDGLSADRFRWSDARGLPRSVALAHNDGAAGAGGSRGGEAREFRYQTAAGTRVVGATADGFGGFGYVVSHPADDASHCTGGGDSSSLGHFTPGTFQRVFEGRHHAILRFTQAYPRYCTRAAPAARYDLPVTIDWMISTGRDHPLWAITYDLSGVPVDRLEDDSRAPYGQMRIDGAASDGARATIAGVTWGDRYRFVSSTDPLTFASAWTWNQLNTIPFVALWTHGADATMGLVQTQTIDQQDAGGYWGQDLWNRSSGDVSGCPGEYLMPCAYNWPFQSANYEIGNADPTQNARLAWGTNFGFLGRQQYRIRGDAEYGGGGNGTALPGDPTAPGWPKKSYSVWIVLGTHSADAVAAQVRDAETVQSLGLSAALGGVATQGRAGVGDATLVTYQPAGYDPVYGALTFEASGNRLDANIAVGSGTLRHPLLIVRGYSGATAPGVRLAGTALVADVDYFASLRSGANEVWITLNRDLTGAANRIELMP
jgi:hypothetical protein